MGKLKWFKGDNLSPPFNVRSKIVYLPHPHTLEIETTREQLERLAEHVKEGETHVAYGRISSEEGHPIIVLEEKVRCFQKGDSYIGNIDVLYFSK